MINNNNDDNIDDNFNNNIKPQRFIIDFNNNN